MTFSQNLIELHQMHLFEMHARTCRFYFVCCIWHNNCPSWLKPWKVYWSSTKHLPNRFVQSKTDMHKITSIWIVRLPSANFSPLPLSLSLSVSSLTRSSSFTICLSAGIPNQAKRIVTRQIMTRIQISKT